MNDLTSEDFKNLRKAAFAVGFGLALGKFAEGCIEAAISAAIKAKWIRRAEKGDVRAQDICKEMKIPYRVKNEQKSE